MKKSLLSGLFWILLANLLVKPFWILGIEVGVQNTVGAEMYGFYFSIFNISYIFNILLDLGITNFNTRNIAQYPKLIDKYLPGILGIKLMLVALYAVVTFSVGALLGYDSTQFRLLAWLTLNQFLNSLLIYLRSNFEGLLLFKWDSLLSIMDRLVMILICGALIWGPKMSLFDFQFNIFHFVYAQTAAYAITAVIATTVLFHKTGVRRMHWNKPFTLAILKKSMPFALLVLLMACYNRLDPIMLQLLQPEGMGDHAAGIYAGAFRLLDALTMIAYLVSVPLLPIYSKLTKEFEKRRSRINSTTLADSKEIESITRMMFSLIMVFAVTAACTLAALDKQLMNLFYNMHTDEYAAAFRIIIFCIIPISTTYVFGTLLTAAGRLKELNVFAASSLILNIATNIILIPRWGVAGSAVAAVGAQSFMAVAQVIAAVRYFHMDISWRYIIKLLSFTLLAIVTSIGVSRLEWQPAILIATAAAVGMALLLKLVNIKELITAIKSDNQ